MLFMRFAASVQEERRLTLLDKPAVAPKQEVSL
jgi:hypothetical protein